MIKDQNNKSQQSQGRVCKKCLVPFSSSGYRSQHCCQQLCLSQVSARSDRQCKQTICWLEISSQDSCSSTFGGRQQKQPKRTSTSTTLDSMSPTVTIPSTTTLLTDSTTAPFDDDDEDTARCHDSICLNGGRCVEMIELNEIRCECAGFFYGQFCEEKQPEGTYKVNRTKHMEYDHISACDEPYKSDFCLNEGVCFHHQYLDASFYSCECSSHFYGQRCEEKALSGSYGGGMKVMRSIKRSKRGIRGENEVLKWILDGIWYFEVKMAWKWDFGIWILAESISDF